MLSLLLLWLAIIAVKVALNAADYGYLSFRRRQFAAYVAGDQSLYAALKLSKHRTVALIQAAGVRDPHVPKVHPLGFGQVASSSVSAFLNYPSAFSDLRIAMLAAFDEALGVYRGRMFDAINPLYWVKLLVYWPTRALSAVGVDRDAVAAKLLQGLYWLALAVIGALLSLHQPEVARWLRLIADKLG